MKKYIALLILSISFSLISHANDSTNLFYQLQMENLKLQDENAQAHKEHIQEQIAHHTSRIDDLHFSQNLFVAIISLIIGIVSILVGIAVFRLGKKDEGIEKSIEEQEERFAKAIEQQRVMFQEELKKQGEEFDRLLKGADYTTDGLLKNIDIQSDTIQLTVNQRHEADTLIEDAKSNKTESEYTASDWMLRGVDALDKKQQGDAKFYFRKALSLNPNLANTHKFVSDFVRE